MLSPRAEVVLKSIIGRYIVNAMPVPSQVLVKNVDLGVSSATIRNDMAHLEREGYVTRPHTSAGSMPTDKGYRFYVETLEGIKLPLAEQRLVSHLFHQVEKEMEEWLRLAVALMARFVQNVAIVTLPKPPSCLFKHVELIAVQDLLALIVLILHGARVRQQLVTFDNSVSQAELTAISNKLNGAYERLTCSQIMAKAKDMDITPLEQQVTESLTNIMRGEDGQEYDIPYLDGLHLMLNQPEFISNERVLSFLELVEQHNLLKTIIPEEEERPGVHIVIGKENKAEVIQDYSVVISRYGLQGEALGTIGIVGPTRMPYARVICTVEYLAAVLSELMSELYGKDTSAKYKGAQ